MDGFVVTGIAHGLTGRLGADERFAGALRVRGGRIVAMGRLEPEPGERVIDAAGAVVCPGLVNTHHHLFQSVLKAVPAGIDLPLEPWLSAVPYRWWPHLDEDALRIAARIGLAELALSGATTICDHHYVFSDRYAYDPAEVLFEEAGRLGLRFVLARGGGTKGRSVDDPAVPPAPVEPLERFLAGVEQAASRWHDPGDLALRRVVMAPTTPTFNVDPGALAEIAQTARALGLRLHTHLSENTGYAAFTEARFGRRPVPWLADHGWQGPDVWFAHLVDVTGDELRLLAETGTGMAHCPQANARLGSGIAPAPALHALGGTVSLAVDGAAANEAADMAGALHAAFGLHRAAGGAAALRAETALHWATAGGARVLGLPLCGTLAPGMAADFAILDLSAPRNMGLHDPALAPIVTGVAQVRHSFVGGRQIVADGRLAGLDLADLAEDARRTIAGLTARMARTDPVPV